MIWIFPFFLLCSSSSKAFTYISCYLSVSFESLMMFSLTFFNFFMMSALYYFSENKGLLIKINMIMTLILLSVGASFLLKNPLLFLVMLEISVLPTSLMILLLSKDEDKLLSVLMMMMINLGASLPFLMFCSWFLESFQDLWVVSLCSCNSVLILLMFLLVLCSKLPIAMFHFWLTKAHVAASACISMVLASLLLKLGSYGMMKYSSMFLLGTFTFTEMFLSWCVLFCLFFSLNMARFVDMKMLVALSSILHMSMMLPLIISNNSMGNISMMFMMLGHGMVSYFLFMVVSIMYEHSLSRSTHYNKCAESNFGVMSLVLFSFSFLNMGVPPFINFLSEVGVCSWLVSFSNYSVAPFLFSMVVSVFFCMFMITKGIFGRKLISSSQELEFSLPMFSWVCVFMVFSYPLFS